MKEKRFRYSCHYNVRHPGQCDGQSGYGVTKLDAIVESIVCTKFSEILECSKSKLLQDMLRKDMEVAQKEVSRAKSELDLKENACTFYIWHISNQLLATQALLKSANQQILQAHIRSCVREALQTDAVNPKLEEALKLLEKMIQ